MNEQFIQGVIFDWNRIDNNSYLKKIEAFKGVEKLDFNKSITFFVGENGSGKSTLLEALAVAHGFNPEGGTRNYVFSTHDTHSELCNAIRISKGYRKEKWGYFLRAESFYNVATQEEEYADITHPSAKYHEKSHGESFLALAQNNMNPNGLYLFDEPEAALSPQRQLTLLMQIYRCAKEGAQFIHTVDLDGALKGHGVNAETIKKICSSVNVPVQMGGGIRTLENIQEVLDLGVYRVIIGTKAVENPDFIKAGYM